MEDWWPWHHTISEEIPEVGSFTFSIKTKILKERHKIKQVFCDLASFDKEIVFLEHFDLCP